MLVDTHAHVQFNAFKDETDAVMQRAIDAEVLVINVGTQLDTSREALKMAEKYNSYAIVGLHPVHTYSQELDEEESHFKTREEIFDYSSYKELANNPRVVGIGECGLDYYRLPVEERKGQGMESIVKIKENQKAAFIGQIKLAKELNKALVIHCRPSKDSQDAYVDILKILDEEIFNEVYTEQSVTNQKPLQFEIHSFTGSPAIVKEFLNRGAYIGMNGIITFDKKGEMAEVVNTVPLERILLETDSPYLAPIPFRGKKNEPAHIKYVAEKLAQLKNITHQAIEEITTNNAKTFFNIDQ